MKLVTMLAVVAVAGVCVSAETFDMKTMFGVGVGESSDVSQSKATNAFAVVAGKEVTFLMNPWRELVPMCAKVRRAKLMWLQAVWAGKEQDSFAEQKRAACALFDGFSNLKRAPSKSEKDDPTWRGRDSAGVEIAVCLSDIEMPTPDFSDVRKTVVVKMGDASSVTDDRNLERLNDDVFGKIAGREETARKRACETRMNSGVYSGTWGVDSGFDIAQMSFDPSGVGVGGFRMEGGCFEWKADKKGNIQVTLHSPKMPPPALGPNMFVVTEMQFKYYPEANGMLLVSAKRDGKELGGSFWRKEKPLEFIGPCNVRAEYTMATNVMECLRQGKPMPKPPRPRMGVLR